MKRLNRTYVIQEDQHLQNLRKIIKRDFFGTATAQEQKETLNLNLNQYISNYKSNQNHLFSEMVYNNNEQWKKNHWWIDKQDKMLMLTQNAQKFLPLPYHNMLENNPHVNGINTSITQQDAKNSFFFNREKNYGSLQSQEYEQAKKVVYNNCKFDDPVTRMQKEMGLKQEFLTPRRSESGNEWQENKKNKGDKKDDLNSPESQDQDQDDGHLMTWGQIQSTPMRIAGPQFRIAPTPQRQVLLNNLNSKINKQKLQSSVKKNQHVMRILGSLTPSINSVLLSKNRYNSSMRRANDSIQRQRSQRRQKGDVSDLLNIKK